MTEDSPLRGIVAVVSFAAVMLLVGSLVAALNAGVAWTLVLLATAYALALGGRGDNVFLDGAAPLYGAGLLVLAELAYWSLELRMPGLQDRRYVLRRAGVLLALALVAIGLSTFVVAVTTLPTGGGILWDAVGVAAVATTLALVARLARR